MITNISVIFNKNPYILSIFRSFWINRILRYPCALLDIQAAEDTWLSNIVKWHYMLLYNTILNYLFNVKYECHVDSRSPCTGACAVPQALTVPKYIECDVITVGIQIVCEVDIGKHAHIG